MISTCDGTSTPANLYLWRINNAKTWRSVGFKLFNRSSEACTADVDGNDRLWNAQLARHCVHRHFTLYYQDRNRVRFLIGWRVPWIALRLVCVPHNSFSWLSHVVDKLHLAHGLVIG